MQQFDAVLTKPKANLLSYFWHATTASFNLARFNPIPQQYRSGKKLRRMQKIKSNQATEDVTRLQTSINVLDSLESLRGREWRVYDIQYLILLFIFGFSFFILPSAPLIKTGAVVASAVVLLMPITQQFFLPSLSIWIYLLYFFSSRFIAPEYRPHIWVKVLPALENVMYGANLSNILSAHTHPVLDIIAWLPYGIAHFALPLICSVLLFLFAAPGTTPVFARAFGYMCMLGVTIQLIFPCTPPWYEKSHGLEPAHYGMEGSPAGLARIDAIFGIDMYTTSFTTAPVPFGAFPSLHAGNAVIEALFMQYCFPRFRSIFMVYVVWIWWATMYLNHHYAVDLVGGAVIATVAYYISRTKWLPRPQVDKLTRWEYEYVEFGDRAKTMDEECGYAYANGFGLGLQDRRGPMGRRSDDWASRSGSSFDSMSRADTVLGSASSTPGILSPVADDESRPDPWNTGRFASDNDLNKVVVR